ncbi:MAG TPA: hypothetical protein VHD33_07425 [Legionellaceae bacterium]|nr:hypothetical protein [Legionellaceae bacterium]
MKCAADGFKGAPEYALSELASIPVSKVKAALYGVKWAEANTDLNINLDEYDPEKVEIEVIPTIKWQWDEYPIDHKFAASGLRYLESRGIPLEIAKKYHIRHAPARQRVLFPVELDGRLIGHQDRLIVDDVIWSEEEQQYKRCPKILSSDNLPRQIPMFADNLNGSDHVIITEGPIDAIKFDYCNGGNIATMGKEVGPRQIKFIKSKPIKKVYIALDPDAFAVTNRLIQEFSEYEVYVLKPLDGYKDFGAMLFEQCYQVFKKAQPVFPGELILHFA